MTPIALLLLYLAFRVKQFSCDFLLQTDWMALTKGMPGREGWTALLTHTAFHAAGTALIMLVFAPGLWWLGIVDFGIHSLIDRVKGLYTYRRGWTPKDTVFWWTLGLDQEAHNLTHLSYILIVVVATGGIGSVP